MSRGYALSALRRTLNLFRYARKRQTYVAFLYQNVMSGDQYHPGSVGVILW